MWWHKTKVIALEGHRTTYECRVPNGATRNEMISAMMREYQSQGYTVELGVDCFYRLSRRHKNDDPMRIRVDIRLKD